MSKSEDVITRAYGNIPKELGQIDISISFDHFPFRGVKYYWILLYRKIKRIMRV